MKNGLSFQEWTENIDIDLQSNQCFDSKNLSKYGRLYTYAGALEVLKQVDPNHSDGWRLPTVQDFENLKSVNDVLLKDASGSWKSNKNGLEKRNQKSQDFSALPAGYKTPRAQSSKDDEFTAFFWIDDQLYEGPGTSKYAMELNYCNPGMFLTSQDKRNFFSVRLVRDPKNAPSKSNSEETGE